MQGVYLPYASAETGSGAGLRVLDYRREAASSEPAAGGTARVSFDGPDSSRLWLVERIAISCTSSTATSARVYAGDVGPLFLVDSTESGNADIADETSPVLVESTRPLIIVWSGVQDGATATATIQYQLVERA